MGRHAMHFLEQVARTIRNSSVLRGAGCFWNVVRPFYDKCLTVIGRHGLERTINDTDPLLVVPSLRRATEVFEPDVWRNIMARVRPDDVIADVGAFIGLYAVAMAKRLVGPGRVFAFEPDPQNLSLLKAQVELNRVGERTIIINAAVSDHDGVVPFIVGRRDVSRVYTGVTDLKQLDEMYPGLPVSVRENEPQPVKCVRLDTIFGAARLDILKIDVEGHERRCSGVALV